MPEHRPIPELLRLGRKGQVVCLVMLAWSAWWYLLGGFDWSQQQLRILFPPLRDTVLSFFWMPIFFMLPAALLFLYIRVVAGKG